MIDDIVVVGFLSLRKIWIPVPEKKSQQQQSRAVQPSDQFVTFANETVKVFFCGGGGGGVFA